MSVVLLPRLNQLAVALTSHDELLVGAHRNLVGGRVMKRALEAKFVELVLTPVITSA